MTLSQQKIHLSIQSFICSIGLVIILLLMYSGLHAQSSENQLIFYKDFYFLNSETTFIYEDYDPAFLNDYGYAMAYQKKKGDRKYRQYELKWAGVKNENNERFLKRNEIQFGYRRGKYWRMLSSKNIKLRHSAAARLYYMKEEVDPLSSLEFSVDSEEYGIAFDYQIGLDAKLGERVSVMIDCSLISLDFGYSNRASKDPTLSLRQQKLSGYDFDRDFQRVLKIGIGINL